MIKRAECWWVKKAPYSRKKAVMWIYEQGSAKTDMDHGKVSVSALKGDGCQPRAVSPG